MKMTRATRWNMRLQNFTFGLILTLFLALGAYASQRYQVTWDWTGNQRHSLAQQSIQAVQHFAEGVAATVYVQEQSPLRQHALELLEKYRVANPKLAVRFVDPDLDPVAARQEEITTYGTVVLRHEALHEKVTELTEEGITNGLVRLGKGGSKGVVFLTGHGERAIAGDGRSSYSHMETLLKGEGYTVSTLNLASGAEIPAGTAALVMAGPQGPLFPVELERVRSWLDDGGRLLLMLDPGQSSGLEEHLKSRYGFTFQEGVVVDQVAQQFGVSPLSPLITEYGDHPVTSVLAEMGVATVLPEARGIATENPLDVEIRQAELLKGAHRGWLETTPLSGNKVTFDEATDQSGPILMGLAVTRGDSRIVAVGDADFAANAFVGYPGNSDLFLNMVRWLAEDENFIAIRPKEVTDAGITMSPTQGYVLFWGLVGGVPGLLLASGFTIWFRRKRR